MISSVYSEKQEKYQERFHVYRRLSTEWRIINKEKHAILIEYDIFSKWIYKCIHTVCIYMDLFYYIQRNDDALKYSNNINFLMRKLSRNYLYEDFVRGVN